MKTKQNKQSETGKKLNDPNKTDPTKQDERDNDATRIRPEKERDDNPGEQPKENIKGSRNRGAEEDTPYKREAANKPVPTTQEPGRQLGSEISKGYNPASGEKNTGSPERDDQGNPVL